MKYKKDNLSRVRITYRVPKDILEFIDNISHLLDVSRNSALTLIIRQYMVEHPDIPDKVILDNNRGIQNEEI